MAYGWWPTIKLQFLDTPALDYWKIQSNDN